MEDKKNPNPQNENGGETGSKQTAKEPVRKKIQRCIIGFKTSKVGKVTCTGVKVIGGGLALWKLADLFGIGKKSPAETPVIKEEEIPEEIEVPEEEPIEEIEDQME